MSELHEGSKSHFWKGGITPHMNKEIKRLEFFISKEKIREMISADEAFVNFSERGKKPDFSKVENPYRFFQLKEAKRWQGITMQTWEDGIIDGSMPYWVILGGYDPKEILPRDVVDFMKKEMFKGIDKEIIEDCYQKVVKYWTWYRKLFFWLNSL